MGVVLDWDGAVATITLDRPASGNALDRAMIEEFGAAASTVRSDAALRAVLVRANGRDFCVGGDVKSFAGELARLPEFMAGIVDVFHRAVLDFASMDVPVVCAVRGNAAGGGLSIACLGDVVVAARSARFVMAYSAIGLSPDGGSSWVLPRRVGPQIALDMFLTNRRLDADQALAAGLVSRVVDDDQLDAEADQLVRRLANGPTAAFVTGKRLMAEASGVTLAAHLDQEKASIVALSGSDDGRAGVTAFVAKQPVVFEGR